MFVLTDVICIENTLKGKPKIILLIRLYVLTEFVLTGNNLYVFDHTLSWGIKSCTPYPIVRINRVRVNEVLLYIHIHNVKFAYNTFKSVKFGFSILDNL